MKQGVHRFIRISATSLPIAKELLAAIADPVESAAGMFSSGFNAIGTGPATHYISSGLIDAQFAAILGNAPITWAVYQQRCTLLGRQISLTPTDVQNLYATADIRTDAQGYEQAVLDLLGMKSTTGVL